jgi:hypothetical protein
MKASSDRVRIYHYWGPCRDAEVRIEIGDLLNPEKIRIRESWDEHERDYVIQRLEGSTGEFSWEVTPNRLDLESLMRLMGSGSLERIRAKVKEIMQQLTENLDSLFFELKAGE